MCLVRAAHWALDTAVSVWQGITESARERKQREAVRRYEANRPYQRCQCEEHN